MLIQQLFLEDSPRRTIDSDLLGRRAFLETLASALLLPPRAHCRVVSLEGAWGEGKTTAIEMALDVIGKTAADLKPFVVRINPWQLGNKDALVRALLLELSKIVRGEARRSHVANFAKLSDELIKYSNALSAIKVEPTGWLFATLAQCALKVAAKLASRDFDLQTFKDRVSKAIEETGRPIIVVVDDLDRLLPEEVVEVIRFVRAVGDFERTTYLLAFDHPRVVEALTEAGVPSAARFLEKIVQLRTHLPPASPRAIQVILESKLSESDLYRARRTFPESESRRLELYSFYIAPLIRDVRTLLRVLARTEMTNEAVLREVEYWEIFAVHVLAVTAPDVFELLRNNPSGFVRPDTPPVFDGKAEERTEINGQLNQALSKTDRRSARYVVELMQNLFPNLSQRPQTRSAVWLERNGRLAAERNLLTFLLSEIVDGGLPNDTVRAILTEEKFREMRMHSIAHQEDQLYGLVTALRDELIVNKVEVQSPSDLVRALLKLSAELPEAPEEGLAFRFQDRSVALRPLVLDLLAQDDPWESLVAIFSGDLILASLILEDLINPESESALNVRNSLPDDRLEELVKTLEARIVQHASNTEIDAALRLGAVLFSLKNSSPAAYGRVIAKLMSSPKNRQVLLVSLTNSIYSSSQGRVAVWDPSLLPAEFAEDFMREARRALSDPEATKNLIAGAKAVLDGGQVVVDSGEARSTRKPKHG